MSYVRVLQSVGLALAMAAGVGWPGGAHAATASGSGSSRQGGGQTSFTVELGGDQAAFSFADLGSEPPRTLSFSSAPTIDCLGELFGGQTVRLSGSAVDSGLPSEAASLQVFLVDGGELGIDRLSVKVSRVDGSVAYFAPLRELESGSLAISCP
jgi:hypothetical protein